MGMTKAKDSESLISGDGGDGGAICGDRVLCTIHGDDRARGASVHGRDRARA
jgi:hypothetical protein